MLKVEVGCQGGKTLLQILREKNIYVPAVCAGRGTCGKCRVKVLQGAAPITELDKKVFTENLLQEGWRLACKLIPAGDMIIGLEETSEENMEVVGNAQKRAEDMSDQSAVLLGIDIGTTTIAMSLINAQSQKVLDEYLTINRQRMYGADVISRIQLSVEGKDEELQQCIRQDLWKGIAAITRDGAIVPEKILIAANTTMIHLLMGYPCDTLGVYPFTPYHIEEIEGSVEEILGTGAIQELYPVPVNILPGITTYVGADIVADMLVCKMAESEKISMLIDLGTNGEMSIGNKDKILVTSTAAGPAFEGGSIVHGTGSIPGAICGAKIEGGQVSVKTIQDKPPVGICGTGTLEILYELLNAEIMDETGYMEDEEIVLATKEDGGQICFLQEDIRELQLAKSAVRAGIETLLLRYGVTAKEVDAVYLAGGFGYHVNVEKCVGIGLLPEEFAHKIKVIGNGSLQGALQYGMSKEACEKTQRIVELSTEVGLAADKDFNRFYMEHMYFG